MFVDCWTFWERLPHSVPSSSSPDHFSNCGCLASVPSLSSRISLACHWMGQKSLALPSRQTIQTRLIDKTWGLLSWKSKPLTTASHCPSQWLLVYVFPIVLCAQHAVLHSSVLPTTFIKRSIILSFGNIILFLQQVDIFLVWIICHLCASEAILTVPSSFVVFFGHWSLPGFLLLTAPFPVQHSFASFYFL